MLYLIAVGIYFQDAKLIAILIGFFLITQVANATTHTQLTYLLRRLQFPNQMQHDFAAIANNEVAASDLVHDYEIASGAYDSEEVAKLDNRYYGFLAWFESSLRSIGCNESTVFKEGLKYKAMLDRETQRPRRTEQSGNSSVR